MGRRDERSAGRATPTSHRVVVLVGAALLTLVTGAPLNAECGTPADGAAFVAAMKDRLRCEGRRVRGRSVVCDDPDAAFPSELDRVATLVFGSAANVDRRSLRREWRCQRAIASGARSYLKRRVRDLARDGRRRVPYAAKLVARALRRCDGVPTGGVVPTVGGECASLASPFEPTGAAHCVRAVLEQVAQTVTGVSIRPNVVVVLTDDQRWDTLGVMPAVRERLAARGVEFTKSFLSTSLCCPDRASVLTGLYAHNHGVTSNSGALDFDHERDTIARRLRELGGYRTALVGKYMVRTGAALGTSVPPGWDEWHVFMSDQGPLGLYYGYRLNTNGVEATYGLDAGGAPIPAEYSTDLLRDRALALVGDWQNEPFFVEYAPFAPHTPSVPAERHAGTLAGLPAWRPPSYQEADLSGKPAWVRQQAFFQILSGNATERTDAIHIAQLETLLAVDEAVAALSDELEARGLTDNTMVLFTSDNGFLWLEHWLTLKNYPYEESVRSPLVVRYPLLVPAPRTVDAFVQSIDFYPTFAELAGVPTPSVNGRSLVPLLLGEVPVGWREEILLEHWAPGAGIDTSVGVRTAQWKLIETDATSGVVTELYDLTIDPYELANVAVSPANAGILADLRARLQVLVAE